MRIVSWNVNGIRSAKNKGLLSWVHKELPDIICLQEIKAKPDQFDLELLLNDHYQLLINSADKAGYSGTATYYKKNLKLSSHTFELGERKFDSEGRTIICEFENFILLNCYFPNGQRDHARVDFKLEYCRIIQKNIAKLKKESDKAIIICGDFNTAHQAIDLKNPKANEKTTGFLPIEREWIDQFIKNGMVDIFRFFHPEEQDRYTWWTYRNDCRKRNIGWRLDYFFINQEKIQSVKKIEILDQIEGSDHCPVLLDFK